MSHISVKTKILAILLGFFTLIAAAFAVYSVVTTANYKRLRTDEVSGIVAYESERVGKTIAEMERNAVDLALAGRQFFQSDERSVDLGISVSVENFSAFTAAVGGGVWFEPYALDGDTRRVCYYAFFDPSIGAVRHDPNFQTEEYDYHTQMWYTTIAAGLDGLYSTVWTEPYYDDTGTNALMTTVGAGIYDGGRFIGMSTVDWEIQSMVDRLSAIKPTENSFVLLASPTDDCIISNTHAVSSAGMSLDVIPWDLDADFFVYNGTEYMSFSRLFGNGWLFSVQIPAREIFAEIETRNRQFTVIIAGSFVVLLTLAFWLLSRFITRPITVLEQKLGFIACGDLDTVIDVKTGDEIERLGNSINSMTLELKDYIANIQSITAEKERIGAELDVATKIQASMLPCIFPAFPQRAEFDIYASMEPAKEVGGDFYDFFLINEHTLAVVIADVSGKGVPAALFMVIAKTLIKNNAQIGKSPEEVFETVNNLLCENNEAGMFVTAILGYLDIASGVFTFVNAGHNPPLLRAGGTFDWRKAKPGFVLAGMEDTFYEQHTVTLNPGDELFLYTDGVTEAVNKEMELFTDLRLLETANRYFDLPLHEFCISIKREIDKFSNGAEQADDITMLVLRYKGGEAS